MKTSIEEATAMAVALVEQYKETRGITVDGEKIAAVTLIMSNRSGMVMVGGDHPIEESAVQIKRYMDRGFEAVGLVRYESTGDPSSPTVAFSSKPLNEEPWAQTVLMQAMAILKAQFNEQ